MTSNKHNWPDKDGFFGEYGGKFVPETLMKIISSALDSWNSSSVSKFNIENWSIADNMIPAAQKTPIQSQVRI